LSLCYNEQSIHELIFFIMPHFNLPPIAPKKAAIILGVLVLVIVVFSAMTGPRPLARLTPNFSGGGVASYGVISMGTVPAYDSTDTYGKGMLYRDEMGIAESSIAPMPPVPGPDSGAPTGDGQIIKSASLVLLVARISDAASAIDLIRARVGGQVGNTTLSEYTAGSRSGEITIWVPAPRFDEALAEIKKLALRVNNESINVSDVSAQFVDMEARLKNLRATESQYLEILKRSGKLSDVLDVTRELSNTRAQIEQLQGQINYLSRQVALSAIRISLVEEASPGDLKNEWRPLAVIKAAAKETLSGLIQFIDSLLVLLVALPLLLLKLGFLGLVLWVLWRGGKAVYARMEGALPAPTEKV
jgi:hypothetical protein